MDPEPSFDFLKTIDTNLLFGTIGIIVLLFCSAMVSASEVALFSLTQKDLDEAKNNNPAKSILIAALLEKPKKLLATILVTNNFMNIGVVMLFSFISEKLFLNINPFWLRFLIEVVVVTFLILPLIDEHETLQSAEERAIDEHNKEYPTHNMVALKFFGTTMLVSNKKYKTMKERIKHS